jgi:hypothetical protein
LHLLICFAAILDGQHERRHGALRDGRVQCLGSSVVNDRRLRLEQTAFATSSSTRCVCARPVASSAGRMSRTAQTNGRVA